MRTFGLFTLLAVAACSTGTDDGKDTDDTVETDTDNRGEIVDNDNDGAIADEDCDDDDPNNYPGNREVCDGQDNDCDGDVDDDDASLDKATGTEYYADADGDLVGAGVVGRFCVQPANTAVVTGDCNDGDNQIFPGADEICDDKDNDCDNLTDDDDDDVEPGSLRTLYLDVDGDLVGDSTTAFQACSSATAVSVGGDCDDNDPNNFPGNTEICDNQDNDCDDDADDDDSDVDLVNSGSDWWTDADGDGYGDENAVGFRACDASATAAMNNRDCDDTPVTGVDINPDGTEQVASGIDEDCDDFYACYQDLDGDDYGTATLVQAVASDCDEAGAASLTGDCDDTVGTGQAINPGATEVCNNGVDDDCINGADDADPNVDLSTGTEYWYDRDSDTYGDANGGTFFMCGTPSNGVLNDSDCDDTPGSGFAINPDATEICNNGVDDNCRNGADDADPQVDVSTMTDWWVDEDGDGFGDENASAFKACDASASAAQNNTDCDDTIGSGAAVNPDATEICNGGIDDDCDDEADGPDAWWDTDWPYRIPVDIAAGANDGVTQGPMAIDVDFRAALDALGDTAALDPDSIRLVYQDCVRDIPVMPFEFIDGLQSLFEKTSSVAATNDEAGVIASLFDKDGDLSTTEFAAPGDVYPAAIYFGSTANTPNATAAGPFGGSVTATTAQLQSDTTDVRFVSPRGGVTSRVALQGAATVGAQTTNLEANGMLITKAAGGTEWLTAMDQAATTLEVLHDGDLIGVVRATGSVTATVATDGGFDYEYTYVLFDKRPEVYAKVRMVLNADTTVGPRGAFWGKAVVPYAVDNENRLADGDSQGGRLRPQNTYAWGAYATDGVNPYGVAIGYRASVALRTAPEFSNTGTAEPGRLVGVSGQSAMPVYDAAAVTYAGVANEVIVDDAVIAIWPFEGLFTSGTVAEFEGALEGITATTDTPQSNL